jgi:phospholipase C
MSTNDPTPEVSSHSNVVTITDESNTLTNILPAGFLFVSEGQPHAAAPTCERVGNTNVFKITLDAGRHKTKDIADKFNQFSGGKDHEYAPFTEVDDSPEELNFMFSVQLQFVYEGRPGFVNVYFAQGSDIFNNWWIGEPSAISNFGEPQLVYTADIREVTLALSGTHDSFTFRQVNVRKLSPIQHVFVLMLENHSFDNMLAFSGIAGIDAATTANSNSIGSTVYNVVDGAPTNMPVSPGHEFADVLEQLCGSTAVYQNGGNYPPINNSGYAANYPKQILEGQSPESGQIDDVMKCFNTSVQLPILYELATQFAVCDHWFCSLPGPTWPNRFFVHGASSNGLIDSPTDTELFEWESPLDKFTYPNGSIYDRLRTAEFGIGLFHDTVGPPEGWISQVAAIKGWSMLNVDSLENFVKRVQGTNYIDAYTFIEPNYGDIFNTYDGGSSQHPVDGVARGEQLIKTVYEAIRASKIWERSMLIITYDEHGGFYDHAIPPGAQQGVVGPGDGGNKYNPNGFPFNQLGPRVPAVIISPWIQPQVDKTVYDHTSVLRTVEKLLNLQHLTERDHKANDVLHLVGEVLRTNCPLKLGQPPAEPAKPAITAEQQQILDQQPLPPKGNHMGFLAIAAATDHELSGGTPAEHAAITAKVRSIKTIGEARVYVRDVVARAKAAQAAKGLS